MKEGPCPHISTPAPTVVSQLEAVQKFTDEPLSMCAACGGRLRKVFSPVGIVFKGSGFYRTDSRNGLGISASDAKKDKQPSESASSLGQQRVGGQAGRQEVRDRRAASAKSSSSEKVA